MRVDETVSQKRCYICSKKREHGHSLTYRGLPKKTGGIGLKITGTAKRTFEPNLQRVRHEEDGKVLKIYACVKCIKAGKVKKPAIVAAAA